MRPIPRLDRPLRSGNEINPDVLGYIFEKYINQKQIGAYYTKEDITEYVSKNTMIPHLLEQARERCSRCLGVRKKHANGELKSADDLITLNLDIRQLFRLG